MLNIVGWIVQSKAFSDGDPTIPVPIFSLNSQERFIKVNGSIHVLYLQIGIGYGWMTHDNTPPSSEVRLFHLTASP
jgi:hypothetical protein